MDESSQLKIFSLDEANAMLPKLTRSLEDLRQMHSRALSLQVEIDALELISTPDENGENPILHERITQYQNQMSEIYARVDEIHSWGCLLKDIEMGLIDFYGDIDGRMVFLCWKLGEPFVSHWHDIGKGFTSREKIA